MDNEKTLELSDVLEARIRENFGSDEMGNYTASSDRLKEMNKKLPTWSLEPPFSYLK